MVAIFSWILALPQCRVFSAGSIEGRLSSLPVVLKGVAKSSFQSSRWSKLCSRLFLVFFFLRSAKEDWLCRIALSRQQFASFVRAVLHLIVFLVIARISPGTL
uniref:Secreted protein n=1 Tax=Ixodes scapularis TaxID=6945 RepID=A0A4D5RE35_IXOSC